MSLRSEPIGPVPEETVRIARAAFPRGTNWMRLRDEFGSRHHDVVGEFRSSGERGSGGLPVRPPTA